MRAIDLVAIERLADLAIPFGFLRAADRLLDGYVAVTRSAGNLMAADYATLKRVRLALGYGRPHDAVARLGDMAGSIGDIHQIRFQSAALRLWEADLPWRAFESGDQAVLYSRLYLELGRLLSSVGQYGDALEALGRGLDHTGPPAPDLARRALVPLQLEIASALLEKGVLDRARGQLDAVGESEESGIQPESGIRQQELAGKLALLTGDLGAARHSFSEILRMCRARGFPRASAQAALNLAHLSIFLNQTAVACDLLNQAICEASHQDDPHVQQRASYLMWLARSRRASLVAGVAIALPLARLGEPMPSANSPTEQTAPEMDSQLPSSYLALFEDHELRFRSRLAIEGAEGAAGELEVMGKIFSTTDSELIGLRLRSLKGLLDYYLQRYAQSAELLEDVVAGLSALGLRPELWQALRILGWCRSRMGHDRPEVARLTERAQILLDEMLESLAPADRPIFLLNKWTSDEEFLASQIDGLALQDARVRASPWPLRPWRRWKLWQRLDDLLRFLDRSRELTHRRTLRAAAERAQPATTRSSPLWRRLLFYPRRRAVLSFLVLPDRVLLTCSRWCRMDFCVSAVTRLELRERVRQWHEAAGSPQYSAPAANRAANEVAAALQLPAVLDLLPRRVRALSIVPDDSLHGLPFAAVTHRGRFLVERFALAVGFDRERPWRVERPCRAARPGALADGALLVGVSRGSATVPPLPGVGPELDALSRWLEGRRVSFRRIEDGAADKAAVLDGLGRCRFAHLACHGVFDADRPDSSGLVLLPKSDPMEVLSIRDLAQADLMNLRHVTLSACWSADNFVLPGRRVISLPEIFIRAGAQSVLGSLWRVDDEIASALMHRFYEYLEAHPRDEALRLAQIDCLEGKLLPGQDSFASHPMAWAGFTLSGNPGRLTI
jgi:CHAT domain-containing protein/tetratricopeptide (TPR) repeat protein